MRGGRNRLDVLAGTVFLSGTFWFIAFYLTWGSFWIKITFSALALALLSLRLHPDRRRQLRFDRRALVLGITCAVILYLMFWAGKAVSTAILPFAERQIGGIYGKGEGTPGWIIFLLLFFITGPSEEVYWRGFLQERLMERFGEWQGWVLATLIYAGVHVWSLNFMLISAAGVAGAFWGALFWRVGNLAPVIISHALWSAFIFTLLPVP